MVTRDLADYASALEVVKDLGVVRIDDIDLELTRRADERYSWVGDNVGSVRGEVAERSASPATTGRSRPARAPC